MSAAAPHTDDLADRLDGEALLWTTALDKCVPGTTAHTMYSERIADLRAAAAELRRLRDRDAALTRLLDAVGDPDALLAVADGAGLLPGDAAWLSDIAAAVEDIDREHER